MLNTLTEIREEQMNNLKKIARMIEEELGWTNGWHISDEEYTAKCHLLAGEIVSRFEARVSPKVADITRIVVIDHQKKNCENFGRIVDEWNIKLNFSYQDDNKTLKVIISDR